MLQRWKKGYVERPGLVYVEFHEPVAVELLTVWNTFGVVEPLTEVEHADQVNAAANHKRRMEAKESGVASMASTVAFGSRLLDEAARLGGSRKKQRKVLHAVTAMADASTKITTSGLRAKGITADPAEESDDDE